MLERYISDLLANRFGRYVRGLDSENLRVAAWRGEIKLQNLQLIPEALSEGLELPVEIRWGHIGLFHLSIPWNSLGSRAVRATIEDVYLLVAPLDTWEMDDMERHRRARLAKFRKVETKLQRYLERQAMGAAASADGDGAAAAGGGWGSGFWARLAAKVLDNVQVTVRNIHLCYEDILSDPRGPVSLGLTLGQLSLQTTDSEWRSTYVQREAARSAGSEGGEDPVYKQVSLEGLAVYCDGGRSSGGPSLTSLPEAALAARFAELGSAAASHAYVISPTSPTLRLAVRPEGDDEAPRYAVAAQFSHVSAVLNSAQVARLNATRATLRHLEMWEAVRRHRPPLPPGRDPRAWWRFLVHCVGRRGRRRRPQRLGWLRVARLLAQRKTYVRLSVARAASQATPRDYQEFTRLEDELSVGELVAFRIAAQQQIDKLGLGAVRLAPAPPQAAGGAEENRRAAETWGQWLFGWGSGSAAAATAASEEEPATAESGGGSGGGGGAGDGVDEPEKDEAAARDEFMRLFAPETALDESAGAGGAGRQRWALTLDLSEAGLTLVNRDQPCVRVVWDASGTLLRRKNSWSASAALGGLEVFDLQASALSTLLKRKAAAQADASAAAATGDELPVAAAGAAVASAAATAVAADTIEVGDRSVRKSGAVELDFNPKREEGGNDIRLSLEVLPHVAVYSKSCAEQVLEMLSGEEMQGIRSAALSRIGTLGAVTGTTLLQALGERQRMAISARVRAPLLAVPDRPEDMERCRLLVVDLGTIEFDNASPAALAAGNAAAAVAATAATMGAVGAAAVAVGGAAAAVGAAAAAGMAAVAAAAGVADNAAIAETEAEAEKFDDHWRLHVTGVQVVVCDSAKPFFAAEAGGALDEVLRGPGARSPVERFDLTFAVRSCVLPGINRLTRLSMHAKLPRLSFNLDPGTYRLFQRLATHAAPRRRSRRRASEPMPPAALTAGIFDATQAAAAAMAIAGAAEDDEDGFFMPEVAGALSTESLLEKSMLLEQAATDLEARYGEGNDGDDDAEPDLDLDMGLAAHLNAAASAPLSPRPRIDSDGSFASAASALDEEGDEEAADADATAPGSDASAAAASQDAEAVIAAAAAAAATAAAATAAAAAEEEGLKFDICISAPLFLVTLGGDGAPLVRAELQGLGGEYALAHRATSWHISLATASVADLFQRSGPAFEQLLHAGPESDSQAAAGRDGGTASAAVSELKRPGMTAGEQPGLRIGCGAGDSGAAAASGKTLQVDVGVLSVNWNPETVAALSNFLHDVAEQEVGGASSPQTTADDVSAAASESFTATAASDGMDNAGRLQIMDAAEEAEDGAYKDAAAGAAALGGVVAEAMLETALVARIGSLRVSFNKELLGRRLVVATATDTMVVVSRDDQRVLSEYSVRLGNLVLADSSTKDSRWRQLLAPQSPAMGSCATFTMSQDVRSDLAFSLLVSFTPVRVAYLNQTVLELMDYFFIAILGDEVWSPWLVAAAKTGGSTGSAAAAATAASATPSEETPPKSGDTCSGKARESSAAAVDVTVAVAEAGAEAAVPLRRKHFQFLFESPEIVLPVSHAAEGHVILGGTQLTAENSYSERPVGGCSRTINVWDVHLSDVTIAVPPGVPLVVPSPKPASLALKAWWIASLEPPTQAVLLPDFLEDGGSSSGITGGARDVDGSSSGGGTGGRGDGSGGARDVGGSSSEDVGSTPAADPGYVVEGVLEGVQLALSREDYLLMSGMVSGNIAGDWPDYAIDPGAVLVPPRGASKRSAVVRYEYLVASDEASPFSVAFRFQGLHLRCLDSLDGFGDDDSCTAASGEAAAAAAAAADSARMGCYRSARLPGGEWHPALSPYVPAVKSAECGNVVREALFSVAQLRATELLWALSRDKAWKRTMRVEARDPRLSETLCTARAMPLILPPRGAGPAPFSPRPPPAPPPQAGSSGAGQVHFAAEGLAPALEAPASGVPPEVRSMTLLFETVSWPDGAGSSRFEVARGYVLALRRHWMVLRDWAWGPPLPDPGVQVEVGGQVEPTDDPGVEPSNTSDLPGAESGSCEKSAENGGRGAEGAEKAMLVPSVAAVTGSAAVAAGEEAAAAASSASASGTLLEHAFSTEVHYKDTVILLFEDPQAVFAPATPGASAGAPKTATQAAALAAVAATGDSGVVALHGKLEIASTTPFFAKHWALGDPREYLRNVEDLFAYVLWAGASGLGAVATTLAAALSGEWPSGQGWRPRMADADVTAGGYSSNAPIMEPPAGSGAAELPRQGLGSSGNVTAVALSPQRKGSSDRPFDAIAAAATGRAPTPLLLSPLPLSAPQPAPSTPSWAGAAGGSKKAAAPPPPWRWITRGLGIDFRLVRSERSGRQIDVGLRWAAGGSGGGVAGSGGAGGGGGSGDIINALRLSVTDLALIQVLVDQFTEAIDVGGANHESGYGGLEAAAAAGAKPSSRPAPAASAGTPAAAGELHPEAAEVAAFDLQWEARVRVPAVRVVLMDDSGMHFRGEQQIMELAASGVSFDFTFHEALHMRLHFAADALRVIDLLQRRNCAFSTLVDTTRLPLDDSNAASGSYSSKPPASAAGASTGSGGGGGGGFGGGDGGSGGGDGGSGGGGGSSRMRQGALPPGLELTIDLRHHWRRPDASSVYLCVRDNVLAIRSAEVAVNWNPRTIAALWQAASALSICFSEHARRHADGVVGLDRRSMRAAVLAVASGSSSNETRAGNTAGEGGGRPAGHGAAAALAATLPLETVAAATHLPPLLPEEIRSRMTVTVSLGVAAISLNKERMERQLVRLWARGAEVAARIETAALDPAVSSDMTLSCALDGVRLDDMTSSTSLYRHVVGPLDPGDNALGAAAGASSRALSFSYKRVATGAAAAASESLLEVSTNVSGDEGSASADGSGGVKGGSDSDSGSGGTVMEMRMAPLRWVYLQPLWLEIIDYILEGTLGYAVWGTPADVASRAEAAQRKAVEAAMARLQAALAAPAAAGKAGTSVTAAEAASADDGSGIGQSSLRVVLAEPVLLLPVESSHPAHVVADLDCLEFATWTALEAVDLRSGHTIAGIGGGSSSGNGGGSGSGSAGSSNVDLRAMAPPLAALAFRHMRVRAPNVRLRPCYGGGDGYGREPATAAWRDRLSAALPYFPGPTDVAVSVRKPYCSESAAEALEDDHPVLDGRLLPTTVEVALPRLAFAFSGESMALLRAVLGGNFAAAGYCGAGPGASSRPLKARAGKSAVASSAAAVRAAAAAAADTCSVCAAPLLAEQRSPFLCSCCCRIVCRGCLTTRVHSHAGSAAAAAPREYMPGNLSTEEGLGSIDQMEPACEPFLICDACAGGLFPELAVRRRSEPRFWYGDDGPATDLKVVLSVPELSVDFCSATSGNSGNYNGGYDDGAENHGRGGGGKSEVSPAGIGIDSNAASIVATLAVSDLEASYSRGADHRAASELALGTFSLRDTRPGRAFPDLATPKAELYPTAPRSCGVRTPTPGNTAPGSPTVSSAATASAAGDAAERAAAALGDDGIAAVQPPPQAALAVVWAAGGGGCSVQAVLNHLEMHVVFDTLAQLAGVVAGPALPGPLVASGSISSPPRRVSGGGGDAAAAAAASTAAGPTWTYDLALLQEVPAAGSVAAAAMLIPGGGDPSGAAATGAAAAAAAAAAPLMVRVTLHNPRILLLEDETDPRTNALVVQGLLALHVERCAAVLGDDELVRSLDVNFRVHQLVSYVHGMGRGLDTSVGVGVLDPLSLALVYSATQRPLHPELRKLMCQVEPVRAQCSYKDLAVISGILAAWAQSAAHTAFHRVALRDAAADVNVISSGAAGGGGGGEDSVCSGAAASVGTLSPPNGGGLGSRGSSMSRRPADWDQLAKAKAEYEVVFEFPRLGIVLVRQGGVPVVDEVAPDVAQAGSGPFVGDELVSIDGESTLRCSYETVVELIKTQPRPLNLGFRRAAFVSEASDYSEYVITFVRPKVLEGVSLTRGGGGDQAVVASAARFMPSLPDQRRPRPGAIVVGVNMANVEGFSFERVERMLAQAPRPLRVRFREVSAWPVAFSHVELQCPECRATLIDDSLGRDMPLLKLAVLDIDITWEGGPGVMRRWTPDPAAAAAAAAAAGSGGGSSTARPAASPLVRRAVGACAVLADYYNGRLGQWEPLVERSTLNAGWEAVSAPAWESGNSSGSSGGGGPTAAMVRATCAEDLRVNVTDAALEGLLGSLREWRERAKAKERGGGALGGPKDKEMAAGDRYTPFVLRNRTGFALDFWTHEARVADVSALPGKGVRVEGDASHAFAVERAPTVPTLAGGWTHRREYDAQSLISVRLDSVNLVPQPLLNLPLVKAGAYFLEFRLGREESMIPLHAFEEEEDVNVAGSGGGAGQTGIGSSIPGDDGGGTRGSVPAAWGNGGGADGLPPVPPPPRERSEMVSPRLRAMYGGGGMTGGGDGGGDTRGGKLRPCELVWEVSLENGRRVLTLRSAVELFNRTDVPLQVCCSTDTFVPLAAPKKRVEEVIGVVPPNGRLPLPLRWSHVEDIRIRPLAAARVVVATPSEALAAPRRGFFREGYDAVSVPGHHTAGSSTAGTPAAGTGAATQVPEESGYCFSDYSILVPTVRAGHSGPGGAVMSTIAWLSCPPAGTASKSGNGADNSGGGSGGGTLSPSYGTSRGGHFSSSYAHGGSSRRLESPQEFGPDSLSPTFAAGGPQPLHFYLHAAESMRDWEAVEETRVSSAVDTSSALRRRPGGLRARMAASARRNSTPASLALAANAVEASTAAGTPRGAVTAANSPASARFRRADSAGQKHHHWRQNSFQNLSAHSGTSSSYPAAAGYMLFRPLAVEIYACLVLRNALPVPLAYRAVGCRGAPRRVAASGTLAPGACGQLLEVNVLAYMPEMEFRVPGFAWTSRLKLRPPPEWAQRRGSSSAKIAAAAAAAAAASGSSSGGADVGVAVELPHQLEVVTCHNLADQLLYLSAELSSPRNAAVDIVVFCDFWVRNLSGLPLTLGEPVLRRTGGGSSGGAAAAAMPQQSSAPNSPLAGGGGAGKRFDVAAVMAPSEVLVAAVQNVPVVEEVFQLRVRHQYGDEEVLWVTDFGNPRPPPNHIRLPSRRWRWADDWSIDYSGAVARDLPGLDGGGWETCGRQSRGVYGSRCFPADRSFRPTDRVWRRRWLRTRVRDVPLVAGAAGAAASTPSAAAAAAALAAGGESGSPRSLDGPASPLGGATAATAGGGGIGAGGSQARARFGSGDEHLVREIEGRLAPRKGPRPGSEQSSSAAAAPMTPLDTANGGGGGGPAPIAVMYQPASSLLPPETRIASEAVCLKVGDSSWSPPLPIGVQGAGGPLRIIGTRWPSLVQMPGGPTRAAGWGEPAGSGGAPPSAAAGSGGGRATAEAAAQRGWRARRYELAYAVGVPSPPWNRTRVVTITSRYTIVNRCAASSLVIRQFGAREAVELAPGSAHPLHWSDARLEGLLSVTLPSSGGGIGGHLWSGPIDVSSVGTFPVAVRARQDAFSSDGGAYQSARSATASGPASVGGKTAGSSGVGFGFDETGNKVVKVEINLGGMDGFGSADGSLGGDVATAMQTASAAVQIVFEEEADHQADRFPTYRLENRTQRRVFYAQKGVPGTGDLLPPGSSCLFGWDQPCPPDLSQLLLRVALEPLSSAHGHRLARSLDIRKIGERAALHGVQDGLQVAVTVRPDGPTKVVCFEPTAWAVVSGSAASSISGAVVPKNMLAMRSSAAPLQQYSASGVSPLASPRRSTPRGSPGTAELAAAAVGGQGVPLDAAGGGLGAGGSFALRLFCQAVRVSVVDRQRGEVLLGSLERLAVSYSATPLEVSVQGRVGVLQIDNHIPKAPFAVLLQPVARNAARADGVAGGSGGMEPASTVPTATRPCLAFAFATAPHIKNTTFIKLLSLDMEDFEVRLDESVVNWAQDFLDRAEGYARAAKPPSTLGPWQLPEQAFGVMAPRRSKTGTGGSARGETPTSAIAPRSSPPARGGSGLAGLRRAGSEPRGVSGGGGAVVDTLPKPSPANRYMYIELLQVNCIRVRLSLQRPQETPDNVYVGLRPAHFMLDSLLRMDSAHIRLDPLVLRHTTTTRGQLAALARAHYTREVKQHVFQLLGSLEALGNPVGLVRDMGQGMKDFVAEPAAGLWRSIEEVRPEEFVVGIARGTGSLLKNSVGGVANSASMITGTISNNLSTLTMDKEYKRRRARRMENKARPSHIFDGLGSGGKSLYKGFSDGLTGVISNPIRGAERDGLRGFAKGVGTGMLGLVFKPVVGVADAATDVLQGVKGFTDEIARFGAATARTGQQVRPRRVLYGRTRALRPYSLADAQAASLLHATRFRDEEYADHLDLGASIVIVTQARVVAISESGELLVSELLTDIQVVEKQHNGILLHLRSPLATAITPRGAAAAGLATTGGGIGGGGPGGAAGAAVLVLPPPPSEAGEGAVRGLFCEDPELLQKLYIMVEEAVQAAREGYGVW